MMPLCTHPHGLNHGNSLCLSRAQVFAVASSVVEFKDKIYAFFITEKTPNNLQLSHLVFSKDTDKALIVERQEDFSINGLTRHRPSVTSA